MTYIFTGSPSGIDAILMAEETALPKCSQSREDLGLLLVRNYMEIKF